MATWDGAPSPEFPRKTFGQILRSIWRIGWMLIVTFTLLPFYALARILERILPRIGASRAVIWAWARTGVFMCGLRVRSIGTPMPMGGARVANHSSWADIFVLLTAAQMYFVAKSEVRSWPFMGWLAAFTGTMFIERKPQAAKRQEAQFLERMHTGDRLGFFPEGTSSDGLRVLPFKSTLFAAFMAPAMREEMWVQPMSVIYAPRADLRRDFYGWWGSAEFGAHLIDVAARATNGVATVVFHPPVRPCDFPDRKALARHCEAEVAKGHREFATQDQATAP